MTSVRARWHRHQQTSLEKDYLPGWYATRTRRRLLVGACAFALALLWVDAIVAWNIAPSDAAVTVGFVLLAIMLVVYVPAVSLLNVATRGTTALAERQLDERQVTDRLRAHSIAHRWTLALLTAVMVVVGLVTAPEGERSAVPAAALFLLLLAIWLTHLVLPLMVAGWRLADPPADDDDREAAM